LFLSKKPISGLKSFALDHVGVIGDDQRGLGWRSDGAAVVYIHAGNQCPGQFFVAFDRMFKNGREVN
jgi:hypothetical protein